ncbi:MAG TPA: hypothetical protein VL460_09290 [Caulobacteraceae bacterium]|jgi:hypothetical protein|nr:hypothetical protein [Caulobacteraceae bacterium]
MIRRGLVLALGLAAIGLPAVAAEEKEPLKLDAATQKRLGVVTAPLVAVRRTATAAGFARVMDPAPLAVLDADIAAAAAAYQASRAEAERTRVLHAADATVSAKVAEAAQAQARADAARLTALRRRVGLEWGPAFATLSDAGRGRLIGDLSAGRTALVRIDMAGGVTPGLHTAQIDLGAGGLVTAVVLGPARSSDPRLLAAGLIARVDGPDALKLPTGLSAPVVLSAGPGAVGVILPRSALLRLGGRTLVYVRRDAGSFETRAAEGGVTDPQGLFVARGFTPGEQVVVQGASALNAAANPPTEAE